jgi:tetraacyldisaccharide 4'-kinase
MRGYKSRPGQSGDEEAEYRLTAPDVPVVAHPDRVAALRAFLPRNPDVSCVVLDDGFQHRCVHRDLDIVLIDATRDTFHDQLLPAGHLREPFDALQRADAVIVTRAGEVDAGLAQEIDRWHGKLPIAWTRHAWTALRDHLAGGQALPVSWLKGKRVVTMLGVGNPKAIIAQLEDGGANVMADVPVGDHEDYDIAELALARGLCGGLDAMVVTRKDWVKIEPLLGRIDRWPTRIIVPQLEMEFLAGQQVLSEMLLNVVRGQARGNDRGIDRAAR